MHSSHNTHLLTWSVIWAKSSYFNLIILVASKHEHCLHYQKSLTLPFLSQSPYLVGSGPFGPPFSPVWGLTPSGHSGSGSFSASRCLGLASPLLFLVFCPSSLPEPVDVFLLSVEYEILLWAMYLVFRISGILWLKVRHRCASPFGSKSCLLTFLWSSLDSKEEPE